MILPTHFGKTPLKRLSTLYDALYSSLFGFHYVIGIKEQSSLKKLLKGRTEAHVAALLVVHLNWYGPDGKDESQYEYLRKREFPLYLVDAEKYTQFLDRHLDITSEEQYYSFVRQYYKELQSA